MCVWWWGFRNDSMIWLISKVRLGDALLLKAQTLQYNYKLWEESSLLIQTLKIITCTPHAQKKLQWDGSYWLRMNEKGCKGHKTAPCLRGATITTHHLELVNFIEAQCFLGTCATTQIAKNLKPLPHMFLSHHVSYFPLYSFYSEALHEELWGSSAGFL